MLRLALAFVLATTLVSWPTDHADAVTTEFPPGYEGYHTYAEMEAELNAAVAAHGSGPGAILKRYLIGKSYEGRNIWVIKISDNVAVDEDEPEVLSEHAMHAREHITLEMGLYMIRLLTENYGRGTALGQRVTKIVNSREIWIVPLLNPDGAEYNISGGRFHGWRKNRQANPGSSKIGIDLNRNFGFMWACCGGGSNKPRSARYRGRFPFEAVEAAVMRDFVLSRRVGGKQQLKVVLNWHSYGEFVIWPYGYTREDVPRTMTLDDHRALVTIGRQMAARNGYRARQGSDSYIYDGDITAWTYGAQRIISFTFEMYPRWGAKAGGFRPPDTVLDRETMRNRETVLYVLEQADCPYRAAGLGATHCGPLNDDFEIGRGWSFSGGSGAFERGDPRRTRTAAGVKQRGGVPSGLAALVTGAAAGANANANDVDGSTAALSPTISLGSGNWRLRFRFTFAHNAAATNADYLRVSVVDDSGTATLWTAIGRSSERNARWRTKYLSLDAWAGEDIRLRVEARDGGADNIVEAAIDDMRIYATP